MLKQQGIQISPDVGGLISEFCGHKGEVFLHLDPEVRFGDAAIVSMDGMDTSHFSGYQPDRRDMIEHGYHQDWVFNMNWRLY